MSSISGSSLSITGSTTLNGLSVASGSTTLSSVQTGNFSQSGSSTFSTGGGLVSLNGQVISNAGVVVGTDLMVNGTSSLIGATTVSGVLQANSGIKIPVNKSIYLSTDNNNYITNNSTNIKYATYDAGKSHDFYVVDGSKFNISQTGTNVYGTETVSGLLTASNGLDVKNTGASGTINLYLPNSNTIRTQFQTYRTGGSQVDTYLDNTESGANFRFRNNASGTIADAPIICGAITSSGTITANAGITVPSGKTLTIASGATLTIASGGTVSIGSLSPISYNTNVNINVNKGGSEAQINLPSGGFYKIFINATAVGSALGKNDNRYMCSFDFMCGGSYVGISSNVIQGTAGYYQIATAGFTNNSVGVSANGGANGIIMFDISYLKLW